MCNANPERTNIVLQESNLRNVVLNLPGPTLCKAVTCAMLADSPQSSQCCLSTSDTTFCGTNCLYNVSQERTVIFSQEDNLYCNVVLICLSQHCTRNYLCNANSQSQTTLHKKTVYNFVWIYLSQRCTRKLLVQCWPIWLTMYMRKITYTMLNRPF